jgi:hypothetical protein
MKQNLEYVELNLEWAETHHVQPAKLSQLVPPHIWHTVYEPTAFNLYWKTEGTSGNEVRRKILKSHWNSEELTT